MQELNTLRLTITAAGAVTKRRFVGYDGAQASVAGQLVLGVAWTDIADGTDGAVTVAGTAQVESGGALEPGDAVTVDAQGRAVAADPVEIAAGAVAVESTAADGEILTGGVLPQHVAGHVLPGESASGAGEAVEILLRS